MNSLEEAAGTLIAVDIAPETARQRKPARREATETKKEPNYHVIIWNDEEHTGDYVIEVLMTLFGHTREAAEKITIEVDRDGKGVATTCHKELAELKCDQILCYRPEWYGGKSIGTMSATIEPAPE
jgi:ATP-dependent Clp protease adaptor protein ClpS